MHVEITPTLVIGLGGTGYEVVSALSKEFCDTYGDLPIVRFIAFDTDKKNVSRERCPNFEFTHLTVDAPESCRDGVRKGYYEDIDKWFPKNLEIGNLSSGSKNNRVLGRFELFINAPIVRDIIKDKIHYIGTRRLDPKLIEKKYKVSKSIKVFIVHSGGGGCGSGMFIDAAYMARDALEANPNAKVIGYTITPTVFHLQESEALNLSGNTYAAFLELNHYMEPGRGFTCTYDKRFVVTSLLKPFDYYYVINQDNEDGSSTLTFEDSIKMIGDAIGLEVVSSSLGAALDGLLTNGDDVLNRHFEDPVTKARYIQAYASIGAESYYYPGREYRELCSNLYAQRLIERLLAKPEDFSLSVDQSYSALVTPKQMGFTLEAMKNNLTCEYNLGKYPNKVVSGFELIDALKKWSDGELRKIQINNNSETACKRVAITLKKHMREILAATLNDSNKGIQVAAEIFNRLEKEISGGLAALLGTPDFPGHIRMQEEQLKTKEKQCADLLIGLKKTLDTWYDPLKRRKVKKCRDTYKNTANGMYDAEIELIKLNSVRDCWTEIGNEIAAIRKDISRLTDNLTSTLTKLNEANESAKATLFDQNRSGITTLIGNNEAELTYNFSKHLKSVTQIHKIICDEELARWLDYNADTLEKELLEHGKAQYEGVKFDMSRAFTDLKLALSNLHENTRTRMVYAGQDRGFMHTMSPQVSLLGVPECLYQRCLAVVGDLSCSNKISVVPTSDDCRVSYMTYKFGLPTISMKPLINLKREYEASKPSKHMHIFGNEKDLKDIV